MIHTPSRGSGRLPSLGTPGEHSRMYLNSPPDLRGINYSKIKEKNRTSAASIEKVKFLPVFDNGEEHPMPYYITGEITFPALAEVPWMADEKRKMKAQAERFSRDTRLQTALLDEIIGDTIHEEIAAVASITLEQSKYEEEEDISSAGVVEEFFVMPELKFQVYLTVWSLLYDTGRGLSQEEFLKLKEREDELILEPVAKKALLDHVLEGADWADDLKEERLLSEISWDKLVYNYHKNQQENALSKNTAMQVLQERLVMQAAGTELAEELLSLLEEDHIKLDEMEKLTTPPRQG
ncbi:uncharacterized protein [Palaemon carinicauda]|uniref:uncharacterized protein n=1 Tax=Palaemon carinicauda TaxID=392227 RepID=UPI0035B5E718